MKYCQNCGRLLKNDEKICPDCGYKNKVEPINDSPSIILNVLSLLFPFVGLILFIAYIRKRPVMAKSLGKFAIVGWVIGAVLYLLASMNLG